MFVKRGSTVHVAAKLMSIIAPLKQMCMVNSECINMANVFLFFAQFSLIPRSFVLMNGLCTRLCSSATDIKKEVTSGHPATLYNGQF